jgi:histone H3/H4
MSSSNKVTKAYISKVAHINGVRITKDALDAYAKLPDKKAVDDMITHASQLAKSLGRKTIPGEMAKVEMHHYKKE